jgi:hypothetical protein
MVLRLEKTKHCKAEGLRFKASFHLNQLNRGEREWDVEGGAEKGPIAQYIVTQ